MTWVTWVTWLAWQKPAESRSQPAFQPKLSPAWPRRQRGKNEWYCVPDEMPVTEALEANPLNTESLAARRPLSSELGARRSAVGDYGAALHLASAGTLAHDDQGHATPGWSTCRARVARRHQSD